MKSRVLLVAALFILSSGLVMTSAETQETPEQIKIREKAQNERRMEVLQSEISKQSAIVDKLREFQKLSPAEQDREIQQLQSKASPLVDRLKEFQKLSSAEQGKEIKRQQLIREQLQARYKSENADYLLHSQ